MFPNFFMKPEKSYPLDKCYDWIEVRDYIQEKYNLEYRPDGGPDFWYYILDKAYDVHNGSLMYLNFEGVEHPDYAEYIINKWKLEGFEEEKDVFSFWIMW